MNITIRKFLSLFIVASMLVSLQPAYAADEYFEKMLGYESNEEVVCILQWKRLNQMVKCLLIKKTVSHLLIFTEAHY